MNIPTIGGDCSAAFLADGYLFGHRRFERLDTDVFRTRLLGRRATVLRGHAAVRAFYEGDRFTRQGAVPRSVVHSLQDVGSVQTLTGAAHHQRKSLFTRLLLDDPAGNRELQSAFVAAWDAAWVQAEGTDVDVRILSAQALTAATVSWLGIEVTGERRQRLAAQCLAMIDGAGSFGPRNWVGRTRRLSTERWARATVRELGSAHSSTRAGILASELRDAGSAVAARELLNLLRPTVAVSHFIVFGTLALQRHPRSRRRVTAEPSAADAFAQEVRRTTPFFPAVGGIAKTDVEMPGVTVRAGDWVLVDLFATDRHPREWRDAWTFDPGRFLPEHAAAQHRSRGDRVAPRDGRGSGDRPPVVVAQGAGDYALTHHCPGEPRTVDLLQSALRRVAAREWTLLDPHPPIDLRRLPARPPSARIHVG